MLGKLLELVGLPSPALLLGVLSALGAVAGWSYHAGHTNGFNAAEAARVQSQDGAVKELREMLASANERAISEAAARAIEIAEAAKTKVALGSALKELKNAKSRPAASCTPADWVRYINTAVDAANRPATASAGTGKLSNAVSPSATTNW